MTKINNEKLAVLFLSILFLFSCANEKKIAYFQKGENGSDTVNVATAYIPRIQPGDILSIYVNSLSPEASSFFNPYTPSSAGLSGALSGGSGGNSTSGAETSGAITAPALSESSSPGSLVDVSGNIELPLVGNIKVAGLTTVEARDTIKNRLRFYLKEPTVTVRFLNYRISIIGEVAHPSVYVIPNERITIPEALSMAGDLTVFARRDNIQIIRDLNGKKVFGYINLTDRDVFKSPFYYLHANDVIYVQPAKSKVESTDRSYVLVPAIVSIISLIVIIFRK